MLHPNLRDTPPQYLAHVPLLENGYIFLVDEEEQIRQILAHCLEGLLAGLQVLNVTEFVNILLVQVHRDLDVGSEKVVPASRDVKGFLEAGLTELDTVRDHFTQEKMG